MLVQIILTLVYSRIYNTGMLLMPFSSILVSAATRPKVKARHKAADEAENHMISYSFPFLPGYKFYCEIARLEGRGLIRNERIKAR